MNRMRVSTVSGSSNIIRASYAVSLNLIRILVVIISCVGGSTALGAMHALDCSGTVEAPLSESALAEKDRDNSNAAHRDKSGTRDPVGGRPFRFEPKFTGEKITVPTGLKRAGLCESGRPRDAQAGINVLIPFLLC